MLRSDVHSRCIVLYRVSCGYNYCLGGEFLLSQEGDISLMPAGDHGLGKFGELWPVDFTAAVMWARQVTLLYLSYTN